MNEAASSVLDQLFFRKPVRQHVKEFGCIFGILAFGIAAYLMYKDHTLVERALYLSIGGAIFTVLGYLAPLVLYPVWKGWMYGAEKIGMVMTLLIMSVTWIIMVTPLSFLLKAIGKRMMDLTFRTAVPSYWEKTKDTWSDGSFLKRQF